MTYFLNGVTKRELNYDQFLAFKAFKKKQPHSKIFYIHVTDHSAIETVAYYCSDLDDCFLLILFIFPYTYSCYKLTNRLATLLLVLNVSLLSSFTNASKKSRRKKTPTRDVE